MAFRKVSILLLCFIGLSNSSMVNLEQEWVPNSGWKVRCLWTLLENDSLQSVRLYNNDQQFFIYRPEVVGPSKREYYSTGWEVDCRETTAKGVTGECVVAANLYNPPDRHNFTCEVSGERPWFRIETKSLLISPFVAPSDAVIVVANLDSESGRVTLNCSSRGLPSPTLTWTIGGQRVPSEFSRSRWNYSTKLFDIWASVSYSQVHTGLPATCKPEAYNNGQTIEGAAAEYNSSTRIQSLHIFIILLLGLVML